MSTQKKSLQGLAYQVVQLGTAAWMFMITGSRCWDSIGKAYNNIYLINISGHCQQKYLVTQKSCQRNLGLCEDFESSQ